MPLVIADDRVKGANERRGIGFIGVGGRCQAHMGICKRLKKEGLGFRELLVFDPKNPVACQDDRRTYLWALLERNSAIGPADHAIRIVSPGGGTSDPPRKTKPEKKRTTMSETNGNHNTEPQTGDVKSNGQARRRHRRKAAKNSAATLIEQAEEMRGALRDVLAKTSALIQAIKENQRRTRTRGPVHQRVRDGLGVPKTTGMSSYPATHAQRQHHLACIGARLVVVPEWFRFTGSSALSWPPRPHNGDATTLSLAAALELVNSRAVE